MTNPNAADGGTDRLNVVVEGPEPSGGAKGGDLRDTDAGGDGGGKSSGGTRASRRIAALRYRAAEAERKREEETGKASERIAMLEAKLQDLEARDTARAKAEQSLKGLNVAASEVRKLETAVKESRAKLTKATEDGDASAIADATAALSEATGNLSSARGDFQRKVDDHRALEGTAEEGKAPPTTPSGSTPAARRNKIFRESNPWFQINSDGAATNEASRLAMQVHQRLADEGDVPVGSSRYYEEIEKAVYDKFPQYAGDDEGDAVDDAGGGTSKGVAQDPVAPTGNPPARRQTTGRTVKLTGAQASAARRMGLTLEQYAANMED